MGRLKGAKMNTTKKDSVSCDCGGQYTPRDESTVLIFACSGAADVGHLADLAARKLQTDGIGKMYCLAGVGGRIDSFLDATRGAGKRLAIDGCPAHCARQTLESAGIADFSHLRLADLGFVKGQSGVTSEEVARAAADGQRLLESDASKKSCC